VSAHERPRINILAAIACGAAATSARGRRWLDMRGRIVIVVNLMFLIATAGPAAAQSGAPSPHATAPSADIKFVGQSRATAQLKRDILTAVAGYSKERHSCGTIATVETAPLPQGYEPKTVMFRVSAPQHFYERWVASLCGIKRAFLVAMWPAPQGGADYKVVEVPPGTEP
jgi:hypothetical protein